MKHSMDSDWHQHVLADQPWKVVSHQHAHTNDGLGHDHEGLRSKVIPTRLQEVIDLAKSTTLCPECGQVVKKKFA